MRKIRPSRRVSSFTESVIREMTRLSMAHGAINLSQGYPDFAAPEDVKQTARFLGRWRRIAPRQTDDVWKVASGLCSST
jgi:hypothetical protein